MDSLVRRAAHPLTPPVQRALAPLGWLARRAVLARLAAGATDRRVELVLPDGRRLTLGQGARGRTLRDLLGERRGGDVADGASAGPKPEAAHAHRVDGEDIQREGEARPVVHQASVSRTARATRSEAMIRCGSRA